MTFFVCILDIDSLMQEATFLTFGKVTCETLNVSLICKSLDAECLHHKSVWVCCG